MSRDPSSGLSKTDIEKAVQDYWRTFTSADRREKDQEACYVETASVFASTSKRLEPARLVLIRRQREYLAPGTRVAVEIGAIEIEMLCPDSAVAAYVMRLDAEQIATYTATGQKVSEEHLEHARVTHVFRRHEDGRVRIVHEHISVPDRA